MVAGCQAQGGNKMNEYNEFLLRILNVIDSCSYSKDERGHDENETSEKEVNGSPNTSTVY